MEDGSPVSQPRGAFQGRDERFSGSVVLQPVRIPASTSRNKRTARFISKNNLISFHNLLKLPAWDHVGNARVRVNGCHFYFSAQLAIAAHHENAFGPSACFLTNV